MSDQRDVSGARAGVGQGDGVTAFPTGVPLLVAGRAEPGHDQFPQQVQSRREAGQVVAAGLLVDQGEDVGEDLRREIGHDQLSLVVTGETAQALMPNGMPSRYQATKNAIQTTQTTAAIGMVNDASVPMPADLRYCWMKPSAMTK